MACVRFDERCEEMLMTGRSERHYPDEEEEEQKEEEDKEEREEDGK